MSSTEVTKAENEVENKTPDKKQIEAEEKEVMLKPDTEKIEAAAAPETKATENEGPVKTALSTEFTEQGREVKPKFIPIGAIKMPGFFTRNSDKEKSKEEEGIEKGDGEKGEDGSKLRHRLQFLHTCPFTQFLHHPKTPTENAENIENKTETKRQLRLPKITLPKLFQKSEPDGAVKLASIETLEDQLEAPMEPENGTNDPVANDEKVKQVLPLKERIRQRKFIIDDMVAVAVAVVVVLACIIGIAVVARSGPPAERPLRLGKYMLTLTGCGPVEGIREDGVYNFYNIPYAVPPTGERRFTYAQPLDNISLCWAGTRDARRPGPVCLQFLDNGTVAGEEDCLTLDVITPKVRYDEPLPVVVLIGANTLSGGISPLQPSPMYARTKEVVFVKPNFRLGAFGFLALDILSKTKYPPTSGNYALSDLVVALDWIQKNIKHFGGDPRSVTLMGHRAGATLTAALTTMKRTQKLYTRAWLSSPSVIFPGDPLEQSEKENERFKLISKCSDAECLRRLTALEVLTATPDYWLGNNLGTLPKEGELKHSWLVLDGDYLRVHAYEAWEEQKKNVKNDREPSIVFVTSQHSAHSELLRMQHLNWTADIVERMVNESAIGEKNLTAAIFKHFEKSYSGLVEAISAVRTLCPLVSLARLRLGAPLYVVTGAGAGAGGPDSALRGLATVDADVQAILGTFDSDTVQQRRFMNATQQLFYYLVSSGTLSGPAPSAGVLPLAQDLLPPPPPPALPVCDLLIQADLVPRYAHID